MRICYCFSRSYCLSPFFEKGWPELHIVRGTKRRPRKTNIKRCHCTGDVKGGLNASLALMSSPGVACGFRYDPNHRIHIPSMSSGVSNQLKMLNPVCWGQGESLDTHIVKVFDRNEKGTLEHPRGFSAYWSRVSSKYQFLITGVKGYP